MGPTFLFVVFVVLIALVLFAIWRYWNSLARVSPEEEEFDDLMSKLNDRQANRLSDEVLTNPLSDEDAWQIMVRRGRRFGNGSRRKPRETAPRLLSPRRERYGGELARRIEERRERTGETARRPAEPRARRERED